MSIVYGLPLARLALPQCLIDRFDLNVLIVLAAGAARNVIAESSQVSIREAAGLSAQTAAATPKIAALLALTGFARAGATRRVQIRRPAAVAGPAQLALGWAK